MHQKITLKSTVTFLLFCLISFTSFGQTNTKNFVNVKAAIDKKYQKLIKKNKVVGASIAIIDNGQIVYAKGFGFADKAKNIKATPNTVYRVGSITKTFTALAIMQLHEKGLIDINESIKKYLPELTIESRFGDGNKIFIKDILTHTSGLPSDIVNGMLAIAPPNMDWAIQELNKQTTISPNQYIQAYSNIGYGLLGKLIERVSGLSYENYLQKNIFNQIEMDNSGVGIDNKQLSKGYVNKKEVKLEKFRDIAAGEMTSSVLDMANFVKMLLQDGQYKHQKLLSKNGIKEMEQDKLANIELTSSSTYGYAIEGRQVNLTDVNGTKHGTFLAHSGDEIAFHAVYGYIPELKVGGVILTNTDNGVWIRSASQLLKFYLKEAKGITSEYQYKKVQKTAIGNTISKEEVIGTYNLGPVLLDVKQVDKIKFKVDNTKIILKKLNNNFTYGVKILLLGFIPIKDKNTQLQFEKRKNKMYLKEFDVNRATADYMGIKTKKIALPTTWTSKFGNYKVINAFKTYVPDFDVTDSTLQFFEENGWAALKMKTPGMEIKYYLNIISDNLASTGGIGRQAGTTIKILANGNLYFSGFEFAKITP